MHCGSEPQRKHTTVKSRSSDAPLVADAAPPTSETDAVRAVNKDDIHTLALSGPTPASVPGSDLTVFISGSFHKIRAPLVGVSVLFSQGDKNAQIEWRIESGTINSTWLELRGRRYDKESGSYVDEEIPGWRVRLDSVDDHAAGGDPTAITISVKRAP